MALPLSPSRGLKLPHTHQLRLEFPLCGGGGGGGGGLQDL